MSSAESRVEKWTRWLEEIENDLIGVAWNRAMYRKLGEIGDKNPDIPESSFFEFLGEAYATSQTVAIRRQAEHNPRGVSFGTLLREIASDPQRLTRERYLAFQRDDHARAWAVEHWKKEFAGETQDHADPKIVEADIARLEEAVEPIKAYVDQHIAHRDRKRSEPPTFDELDRAIDTFEELIGKYGGLLRGAGLGQLEPTPQYDWMAPFRVAWITDE
jgi:hypothetical protein